MATSPVERIGRYLLRRRIGSGAFATVWLAHDPEFDVTVAVKVLGDNWAATADVRDRFLSEAKFLRRITDPRVVRVYDVGVSERNQPYFVMDYIPGGTIAAKLDDQLHPSEALRLAAESALAVQALHDEGVLHRDVKPSNLLIDTRRTDRRVLISDLGTAKLLAEASGYTVTTGTPAYMAPEQARGQDRIDVRADVYSLAVLAYELLAGRRPFDVAGLSDPVVRTVEARPQPLADELGLPPRLDDVFAEALSTDRERRPATATAFARQLTELANKVEQLRPAPDKDPTQVRVAPSSALVSHDVAHTELVPDPRRTGLVWLAIALFVVSAFVGWVITQLLR